VQGYRDGNQEDGLVLNDLQKEPAEPSLMVHLLVQVIAHSGKKGKEKWQRKTRAK
jgi:hypothetical protein